MKLKFARIVTRNVEALVGFYRDITGLAPSAEVGLYVEFDAPGLTLAIVDEAAMERNLPGATSPAANRSIILDLEVEDVDHERNRIGSFVKDFVLEPTNQPWGNRAMLFRDPDGNLINVFAPIPGAARGPAAASAG